MIVFLEQIELTSALEPLIAAPAPRYQLRALDAIQLASGIACAQRPR